MAAISNFDIFTTIRASCAAVAEKARHVHIDAAGLAAYAAALPLDQARCPTLDPESHLLDHEEDTAAFFLVLDAVNFGSGYFPHLNKLPGKSGYFTVATRLKSYFERSGPPSATDLTGLDAAACARIFGQGLDDAVVAELMGLFARALNDLGHLLLERADSSYATLIGAADGSAARLVEILATMPFFRDVHAYQDHDVLFYKRAQLTAADLALAFNGQGPGRFDDLDRLTIFADNLVPHVLRVDKVLLYEDTLAKRIDEGQLIRKGSAEEIEIRACALHAVEQLCDQLRGAGHSVSAHRLDYLLWNRGQQPFYKARPRHRCRCVSY
jgi:hypothetical protein